MSVKMLNKKESKSPKKHLKKDARHLHISKMLKKQSEVSLDLDGKSSLLKTGLYLLLKVQENPLL